MDRAEAIRELTQWRDQMKSHGVPNYGKKLTALALAIEALQESTQDTQESTQDLISRADIEYHTQLEARGNGQYEEVEVAYKSDIDNLPSAATDMSEYCDRLWKIAYERGKAEGLSKLKNPCDSLLKPDSDECKERKSKLDLISRQAAIEVLTRAISDKFTIDDWYERLLETGVEIEDLIKELPRATPTERTGEWVQISPARIYECSKCGQNVMTDDIKAYKFCHGCGTKMVGEKTIIQR